MSGMDWSDEEIVDYASGAMAQPARARIEAAAEADPRLARQLAEAQAELTLLQVALEGVEPEDAFAAPPPPRRSLALRVGGGLVAGLALYALGLGTQALLGAHAGQARNALAELAAESHSNSLLRLRMASQFEHENFDPQEILAATGIELPVLPEDWRVSDVQVYPSPYGPSVEMAVQTPDNGIISIWAVRPGTWATVPPVAARVEGMTSAVFQVEGTAYVVVGAAAPEPLDDEASELFAKLD